MYQKAKHGWEKHLDFIILDLVCMLFAYEIACFIWNGSLIPLGDELYRKLVIVLVLFQLLVSLFNDSFKNVMKRGGAREFSAAFLHVCLITLLITFYLFLVREGSHFSRAVFLIAALLYLALTCIARALRKYMLKNRDPEEYGKRSLVILTSSGRAEETIKQLKANNYDSIRLSGLILMDENLTGAVIAGVQVVSGAKGALNYICREWVDEVLVDLAVPQYFPPKFMNRLISMGVTVHQTIALCPPTSRSLSAAARPFDFSPAGSGKASVSTGNETPYEPDPEALALAEQAAAFETVSAAESSFGSGPDAGSGQCKASASPQPCTAASADVDTETARSGLLTFNDVIRCCDQSVERMGNYIVLTGSIRMITFTQAILKRALDICGGLVGCFFTGILILTVGPLIYIADPGPIFFSQMRVGRNGKKFKCYKFRSMYQDAEARKAELMAANRVADGLMFKLDHDPRIIGGDRGVGGFIRRYSIDEFPQFLNVLKGEMSLVGTRPPTIEEWEKYELHHRSRLAVKPGITGMWQISGRSNITDFEEVVKLDTQYISSWSLALDISILLKTVVIVFKHEGSM